MCRLILKPVILTVSICISVVIWLASWPYFSINKNSSIPYLTGRETYMDGLFSSGLYLHAMFSPIILVLAAIQLTYPKNIAHRLLGVAYIVLILLSVPGALILAYHAYGGIWVQFNLFALTACWIGFTAMGVVQLLKRQWDAHRRFMLRSGVLTFSAIALRLMSYVGENFLNISNADYYPLYTLLNWLPILIGVEIYIRHFNRSSAYL